jgi:hypothetical protein
VDPERVKRFEEDHVDPPMKDSVQMDWPLPFSSPWNSAAIHVLAKGFAEDVLTKSNLEFHPTETSLLNIKALVTSKLTRTRREYNEAQHRDPMDTEYRAGQLEKSATNRRHTRRIGVSVSQFSRPTPTMS